MSNPQAIPEWWCVAVVKALESYDSRFIGWTARPSSAGKMTPSARCGPMLTIPSSTLSRLLELPGYRETTAYPGQKAVYGEFFFSAIVPASSGGQPSDYVW